jgi:hypothetical protein
MGDSAQHHVDHREEAVGHLDAAFQQAAITHAVLYVGDELRAIRQSIEGVTRTGGVSLADVVAGAVDHATTEVANAAQSFAEHGGGWRGR